MSDTDDEEEADRGRDNTGPCVSCTDSQKDDTYSTSKDSSGNVEHLGCSIQTASLEDESDQYKYPENCGLYESESSSVAKNGSLLNGEELIDFLRSLRTGSQVTEGVTTIGLVS